MLTEGFPITATTRRGGIGARPESVFEQSISIYVWKECGHVERRLRQEDIARGWVMAGVGDEQMRLQEYLMIAG